MPPFQTIKITIKFGDGLVFTGELHCEWGEWQKMRDREKGNWVEERLHSLFDFDWEEVNETGA